MKKPPVHAWLISWPCGKTVSPIKPAKSEGMTCAPLYTTKPSIANRDAVRDRVSHALFQMCYNEGSSADQSMVDAAIRAVEESL